LRIDALDALGVGTELGHGALEGPEVVDHGLVDQDVAVGQKQDALFSLALPQPPDDLKRGVGLAGAGGHDQQHVALATGDGLDRAVDGVQVVVARRFARGVVKFGNLAHCRAPAFPGAVAAPQLGRAGKLSEREVLLQHAAGQRGVAKHKAVDVAGERKRHIEQLGVVNGLGHARAHRMPVVLGLNHGQRDVGLEKKRVVGSQHGGLIALGFAAAHHHAPGAQGIFPVNLIQCVPAGLLHGGADELVADVAFAEVVLVHSVPCHVATVCELIQSLQNVSLHY